MTPEHETELLQTLDNMSVALLAISKDLYAIKRILAGKNINREELESRISMI